MPDTSSGSWKADASGRERIRYVVELLDGPSTVQTIAERADVSRTTADDELARLERDDWVLETTLDGKKAYDLNPVRMLFDEITDLIGTHSREELEGKLTELTQEREELAAKYDVDSLQQLRETLVEDDVSADELRERRNVIETWEALDMERNLVKHALQLYGDVSELSSPATTTAQTLQG
ncbi:winged helix-turn-helix domain-containing protein [Halobacteria archaeon AArc-m2/3/4]|uniref:Winged helix-turn-helix domain-containing protein n=1 Tax=Natronoglomus mannanivorans TaxID=2979990 RepID=A0ABT2Q8D2_9EURY|nr:winged helix-turn-helix domain-containing protein [Halobacteria archaeon AArc-m2/3/4]